MMIIKVYDTIQCDKISVSGPDEYKGLPANLEGYTIAYTGKHRAFFRSAPAQLTEEDMDQDLLIDCRLFNEEEEIFIYPRMGKIWQRVISGGSDKRYYIEKEIQLRNEEGRAGSKNAVLIVRHYLSEDPTGGYDIMRFVNIKRV